MIFDLEPQGKIICCSLYYLKNLTGIYFVLENRLFCMMFDVLCLVIVFLHDTNDRYPRYCYKQDSLRDGFHLMMYY